MTICHDIATSFLGVYWTANAESSPFSADNVTGEKWILHIFSNGKTFIDFQGNFRVLILEFHGKGSPARLSES
jgi:hypothetical protein